MIFESLSLENFGAYAGVQNAILAPAPGKPVVLFGGMNGGGKTTLLDALQLVLYGPRARTSTRGRAGYHEFLLSCINRNVEPHVGATITLRFSRFSNGQMVPCEVQRAWRETGSGVVETVTATQAGEFDSTLTDHWDEFIEGYLPSRIAHLFFFDGEQIKELAERENAAEILGTAIHSLLGLDIVDRLQADLKVLERRKRAEVLDGQAAADFSRVQLDITNIEALQSEVCFERAALENTVGRHRKDANDARERFRAAGGDTYARRAEIEKELTELRRQESIESEKLRDLLAGPLPLAIVSPLLAAAEADAQKESQNQTAAAVLNAVGQRDSELLALLKQQKVPADAITLAADFLENDRNKRALAANSVGDQRYASDAVPVLAHTLRYVLPSVIADAEAVIAHLATISDGITRLERDLASVPDADSLADLQQKLDHAEATLREKNAALEAVALKQAALTGQRADAERRLERFADGAIDAEQREDSRGRILRHSARVRSTLTSFRSRVVQRHIARLEALILESLQQLFRKRTLAAQIVIDPDTFNVTLVNASGQTIPFHRLSAGERQLLATALLWGLARASGRPVPTVIDTPLGRLDSTHRQHLVRDYFPRASHQVILLSTDEEIRGAHLDTLRPSIARTYRLNHNDATGASSIEEGYFEFHNATT